MAALLGDGPKRWLDLCCGSGRALVEAAGILGGVVELRIRKQGHAVAHLPLDYLGADRNAGPNYTGQPAVHSYYQDHG